MLPTHFSCKLKAEVNHSRVHVDITLKPRVKLVRCFLRSGGGLLRIVGPVTTRQGNRSSVPAAQVRVCQAGVAQMSTYGTQEAHKPNTKLFWEDIAGSIFVMSL